MRVRVAGKGGTRTSESRGSGVRRRQDGAFSSSDHPAVLLLPENPVRFPDSQRIPTPSPTKLSPFPLTSPDIPMEEMP